MLAVIFPEVNYSTGTVTAAKVALERTATILSLLS